MVLDMPCQLTQSFDGEFCWMINEEEIQRTFEELLGLALLEGYALSCGNVIESLVVFHQSDSVSIRMIFSLG